MWMPGIGDARRQIIIAGGVGHFRHVKIRLFKIATHFYEHFLNEPLGLLVMNKARFQFKQNVGVLLDRQLMLSGFRIERRECLLNEFSSKLDERQRTLARRVHQQLTFEQQLPSAASENGGSK